MNDTTAKKHLNLISKIILFICFSTMNTLPFITMIGTEKTVADICIKLGLPYVHNVGETITLASTCAVLVIGMILLIITEAKIYKKTDISDGFFIFSPLAVAFSFVLAANIINYFTDILYDGELFLLYCSVLEIIKAFYDIIRLIKLKKYKLIPLCFLCMAGTLLCLFSPYLHEDYRLYIESISHTPM